MTLVYGNDSFIGLLLRHGATVSESPEYIKLSSTYKERTRDN